MPMRRFRASARRSRKRAAAARHTIQQLFCLLPILAASLPAEAQQDRWRFTFAPHGWWADSSGRQTARGVEVPVEHDFFDDALDNADEAFHLHFEGTNGKWSIVSDPALLSIETAGTLAGTRYDADAEVALIDVRVARGIVAGLQLQWGLRRYDAKLASRTFLAGPGGPPPILRTRQKESWTDYIVGARYRWFPGRWSVLAEADFGGLALGDSSDRAWNAALVATYGLSRRLGLSFGYRLLDVNFDRGGGSNRFDYDIETAGPLVGVSFEF